MDRLVRSGIGSATA